MYCQPLTNMLCIHAAKGGLNPLTCPFKSLRFLTKYPVKFQSIVSPPSVYTLIQDVYQD